MISLLEKSGHHIRNITELCFCANPHAFLINPSVFQAFLERTLFSELSPSYFGLTKWSFATYKPC